MSIPVGIDFGNLNSIYAVTRNKGIDIVVNEVSNRSTPTIVGFGEKNRFIGEAGKTKQASNVKNTVGSLKRILGLSFEEQSELAIEQNYVDAQLIKTQEDNVGVRVNYLNQPQEFSSTQLAAMFFSKSKRTIEDETKAPVTDAVITVPAWYGEKQRYAVHDAAKMADLNPVNIINETTAAAITYGLFKPDLPVKSKDTPEVKPRIVGIIDIGHSTYTCSIIAFYQNELKVLGTGYDKHFGGRNIDYAIANHFVEEFKSKYKIDISTNPKAFNRIVASSEKLKKVLSVNTSSSFSVESVMDDIDVKSELAREDLEEMISPLLSKVSGPVELALNQAKISVDKIDSIELIGGTTRVPAIKQQLSQLFKGRPLASTINQDEAIAKGAAFVCATHSPIVRVRPYKFQDINPYSVTYEWERQDISEPNEITSLEVFPKDCPIPSTKIFTLPRSGDFSVHINYTNPLEVSKSTNQKLSRWHIHGISLEEDQESVPVELRLRSEISGFYIIRDAYTLKQDPSITEKPNTGEKNHNNSQKPKYVRDKRLNVKSHTFAISHKALKELKKIEEDMIKQDILVEETEERKNSFEEYIYNLRAKLEGDYVPFVSEDEKEKLQSLLLQEEDWLYEDGEDASKEEYMTRHDALSELADPIRRRYLESEKQKQLAKDASNLSKQQQTNDKKVVQNNEGRDEKSQKIDKEGDVDMAD
ncbi:hypothetical protein TBLA_0H03890 [Henningerozyma blattae CBS 6284]|uniref:Uncharacterized protein n=1 Tax=Henningerozyma blattae (strain ATCC 34711 / CBS 6284 / DSM 70876 / NBRC 10599 / NRRL Y-10934 / UCD 77-7) TaxID=1071380 RepID=I2H8G8_HENB6|nr:hypothetical protein TBLA_0H03890 [Tetrapisispora blattae CBS 6284]CCH62670.1 hypothetical protein TBLA_0H03890 [Tetrapisispora blattae CBS 6284]